MTTEEIKEGTKFIKERIDESFFPEEKATLYKGLKLMNLSLGKYLQLQMKQFSEEKLNSDTIPEIDILNLPNTPIAKKMNSMGKLKRGEEKIMEDFAAVQLTLCVIMFEYFRRHLGVAGALEYAKYMVRSLNKLKTRIGTDPPEYVERFLVNMGSEIKFLEEDLTKENPKHSVVISQEEVERIQLSLHYMARTPNKTLDNPHIQKTVQPIHFDDYSGSQFERLAFAYVLRSKKWDGTPEWIGQVGSDGGRDIWAVFSSESYCYACANFKSPTFTKAKSDIDRLKEEGHIPNNLVVLFGGSVNAGLRSKIKDYGKMAGAKSVEVWSGNEFEEKLRHETPALIKRFCNGEEFPDSPDELVSFFSKTAN